MPINENEVNELYHQANEGSSTAEYKLGKLLYDQHRMSQVMENDLMIKSIDYLTRAAHKKHIESMYLLGR